MGWLFLVLAIMIVVGLIEPMASTRRGVEQAAAERREAARLRQGDGPKRL